MSFNILTVCTGNICRSPFAELLLGARVGDYRHNVVVSSAGLAAAHGQSMPHEMVELTKQLGVDPSNHRSRFLTENTLRSQDLILTMTQQQRKAVVELEPRKSARTFTLRQFARILSRMTSDDLLESESNASSFEDRCKALVIFAANNRGESRPATHEDDDVTDPYRGTTEDYRRSVAQMLPAIRTIGDLLDAIALSADALFENQTPDRQ